MPLAVYTLCIFVYKVYIECMFLSGSIGLIYVYTYTMHTPTQWSFIFLDYLNCSLPHLFCVVFTFCGGTES